MITSAHLDEYFTLFACCYPVKGAKRSLIIDTQRNRLRFIPNELFDILNELKAQPLGTVISGYSRENVQVIEQYFEILLNEELGQFTDNKDSFMPIPLEIYDTSYVSNSIIDIRKEIKVNLKKFITEIALLGCRGLQLRIFENIDLKSFENLIVDLEAVDIEFVEILLNTDYNYNYNFLKRILLKSHSVNRIILCSSSTNRLYELNYYQSIYRTTSILESVNNCGMISPDFFCTGLPHILEAKQFNSCLNKKHSVDENGFIKNCPSCKSNMGKLDHISIEQVIESEQFKFYSQITKNDILVCKDCEFRYICTDCRQYIQDPDNIYSKPSKCNYNPYTATWD